MPHIIVRGVPVEQMRLISKALIEDLAIVCECGTDNFMVECIHTTSIFDGEIVESYPFIEVAWFERGPNTRDLVAHTLTRHVHSLGIPEVEIAFIAYREDSYYINGKRCDKE